MPIAIAKSYVFENCITGTEVLVKNLSPISYTAYPISVLLSGPISGCPIAGTATTDIGVNIGCNIGCPDIGV
jgi:hypothetical protein